VSKSQSETVADGVRDIVSQSDSESE